MCVSVCACESEGLLHYAAGVDAGILGREHGQQLGGSVCVCAGRGIPLPKSPGPRTIRLFS